MIFNISFDIASLVIQFIIIVILTNFYSNVSIIDKIYNIFIFMLILATTLDIIRCILLNYPGTVKVSTLFIITSLFLLSINCTTAFAYVYVLTSIHKNSKSLLTFAVIPIILTIVLLVINAFFGFFFYFENNHLFRGKFHIFNFLISFFYIFHALILILFNHTLLTKKQLYMNFLAVLFPILTAVIQIFIPSSPLVLFGATLSAMIILLSMESPDEMKQIELEKKYAEDANKAKSQFFISMSHEIRTPVNTIMGMNEVILREATEPAIRKYAMDVKYSANTLLSLINDFLDLSKIESGKMEIIPVEYDLSELLYELITMVKVKAEDKGLIFNTNIQGNLPKKYFGDNIRLRQILINLLTNAIKYTKTGSVSLILNGFTINGETQLHFEVMDTGIGIKPENIKLITEVYTRIEENQVRNIEGTGLGLGIVKSLLNQMNSELDVESIYGKGSIFSFNLIQPVRSDEPIGKFMDKIKNDNMYFTYKIPYIAPDAKILLVDDNSLNRKVFSQLLKNIQVNIYEAESGIKTLDLVQKEKYDIIFLDHMMPEMDGIETMRKMKELENNLNKDTPVIMLTANVVMDANNTYFSEGFKDYITKPITPEKLEKLIKLYLPESKIRNYSGNNTIQKKLELDDFVDSLPVLDEFDWDYARKFYKNKEMLVFTLKNVCQSLGNEAYKLDFLYENISINKNLDEYRITVHALKSTMAMSGGLLLSKLARLCEVAAKDKDYDKLEKLHPILIEEMFKHHERLLIFTKDEDIIKIPFDSVKIKKVLEDLKDSLGQNRYKEADKLSEKLQGYDIPAFIEGYFEKLSMQIVQFETKNAIETIDMIYNILNKKDD